MPVFIGEVDLISFWGNSVWSKILDSKNKKSEKVKNYEM